MAQGRHPVRSVHDPSVRFARRMRPQKVGILGHYDAPFLRCSFEVLNIRRPLQPRFLDGDDIHPASA